SSSTPVSDVSSSAPVSGTSSSSAPTSGDSSSSDPTPGASSFSTPVSDASSSSTFISSDLSSSTPVSNVSSSAPVSGTSSSSAPASGDSSSSNPTPGASSFSSSESGTSSSSPTPVSDVSSPASVPESSSSSDPVSIALSSSDPISAGLSSSGPAPVASSSYAAPNSSDIASVPSSPSDPTSTASGSSDSASVAPRSSVTPNSSDLASSVSISFLSSSLAAASSSVASSSVVSSPTPAPSTTDNVPSQGVSSINTVFTGKNDFITGSSRGLGLRAAESLVRAQIFIFFITFRSDEATREAKKYLESIAAEHNPKCQIVGVAVDTTSDLGLDILYKAVVAKVDRLHILIANTGDFKGGVIETHPISAFREVLDVNITAVFVSIQKHLILITDSIAGIGADVGGCYGYVVSKAGVNHLDRALALDLGPRNITVNVLAPGFFRTEMTDSLLDVMRDTYVANNPRRRLGNSQDFMGIVQFMCSGVGSDYLNGVVLPIDGGIHLVGRLFGQFVLRMMY
ncbi:hypothetical protein BABINDRAFT_10564, partial [Babjeviella inositovora NRRL Y-12698]